MRVQNEEKSINFIHYASSIPVANVERARLMPSMRRLGGGMILSRGRRGWQGVVGAEGVILWDMIDSVTMGHVIQGWNKVTKGVTPDELVLLNSAIHTVSYKDFIATYPYGVKIVLVLINEELTLLSEDRMHTSGLKREVRLNTYRTLRKPFGQNDWDIGGLVQGG